MLNVVRAPGRPSRAVLVTALVAASLAIPSAPTRTRAAEPDFPPSMSGYHNYPEMVAEIEQAAADHPDIVGLFSIGKSHQGRDIWAAKISDNVATDEDEPEVLIDALHHAREHLTVEQNLAVLRWLTDGYGTDESVTRLVDTREIYLVFALNPDGMQYDLTGNPFRAWRKNRQPNAGSTYIGTDLNRNYGYRWGCCNGSSGNPASITYRGPRPFSAPETQAFRDFVASRVVDGIQQIRAHITLHTNGQLVLWPYGYTKTDVPSTMTAHDHRAFVTLGRAMASLNGYRPMQSSDLYITDGDQIDWLYHTYRIFSYTFELYPPETPTVWGDHYPDDSRIPAATERNRGAILHLIDMAWCPYAQAGSTYLRVDCGPLYDDFELNRDWTVDPDGTDTATTGRWQIANPQPTWSSGYKQLDATISGAQALVTGAARGAWSGANDLDGTTTVRSRAIQLPEDPAAIGPLTFRYTFAHTANSSAGDALRVMVEGADGARTVVFQRVGSARDVDASWASAWVSVAAWAGQSIHLVIQATDGANDTTVEAVVDDVRIRRP
jgi:hypothetical protein